MSGRQRFLWLSVALIVVVNAWILASVQWNRQEPLDSQLQLSQRELLSSGGSYETGRLIKPALRIDYRWPLQSEQRYGLNLSHEQMLSLGFAQPRCEREQYRRQSPRPAFMALELNGPAYQQELAQAQQRLNSARAAVKRKPAVKARQEALKSAENQLQATQHNLSRLLVVAVHADAEQLRKQYPDRSQYAIVPATVEARIEYRGSEQAALCGGSARMSSARLNVPLALRAPWLARDSAGSDTGFSAQVAFGRALEPWLQSLELKP
jgi:hypothetical protein